MRQAGARQGNNLFAIDGASIKATLEDANRSLLQRRDRLIDAMQRGPKRLETEENIEKAETFALQLDAAASEARRERLADGKPFRLAEGVVNDFFRTIEAPLRNARRLVQARLTEAALRARLQAQSLASQPGLKVIGQAADGSPVVTTAAVEQSPTGSLISGAADIKLKWQIRSFDRQSLDLEALRPFLTEASLLAACRKHLEENGPNSLEGATYEEIAAGR